MGQNFGALFGVAGLLSGVVGIIFMWVIFAKAGYNGARSLLMLIPVVNVVIFLMFVFGEWPVRKEVEMLRQQLAMSRPGMYPPMGPQYPPNMQPPQYPPYPQYR